LAGGFFILGSVLLGYKEVRNYDGSRTEWSNLIGAPIVNQTASFRERRQQRVELSHESL
jgi:hypothetical protein